MPTSKKANAEWKAWHLVCQRLLEVGAVTQEDLSSRVNADSTPGQRLLNTIRAWAHHRVVLCGGDDENC